MGDIANGDLSVVDIVGDMGDQSVVHMGGLSVVDIVGDVHHMLVNCDEIDGAAGTVFAGTVFIVTRGTGVGSATVVLGAAGAVFSLNNRGASSKVGVDLNFTVDNVNDGDVVSVGLDSTVDSVNIIRVGLTNVNA